MNLQPDKKLIEEDARGVIKMMFDTIPRNRHIALSVACQYHEVNTKGLAHYLHLPTEAVKEILQELNSIGMATRRTGGVGMGDMWSIKPKYRDLFIAHEEGTEWRGGNLIHVGDDDEDETTEMQKLPKLSMFSPEPTGDDSFDEEVSEANDRSLDNLFNSL